MEALSRSIHGAKGVAVWLRHAVRRGGPA